MKTILEKVDLLEDKLTKLILKQEQLLEDNKSLRQSVALLQNNLSEKESFIKDLEEKYKSLKVANAMVGSKEDKHLTKIKINTLIREIDKCIVQLSE
jgi:chromosome segregation ATPase